MVQGAILFLAVTVQAQWTPAPNAVKLPDSLVFATTATVTNTVLTWHPVHQRYYSARAGNATFPLHTWLATGGPSIAQTTAGIDTRGLWYNPNTGLVERNGFAAIGWATMDIDGGLNATNTFTSLFTGQLQPTTQAVGTYDPVTNTVLFYSAGVVQVRSRATGAVLSTLPLTGVPLVSIANDIMIHTGQAGYEIGLLNVAAKQVLFFSRATGVYTGMSQLPASAVTSASYRMGYANDRFWLFNGATKTWNAYCLWNEGCAMNVLPVELLDQQLECEEGQVRLRWWTGSEQNASHFVVEGCNDASEWRSVGRVQAVGQSQQTVAYEWWNAEPLAHAVAYFRLRQVDLDGREEVFPVLSVERCFKEKEKLAVMPNPTDGWVMIGWNAVLENGQVSALRILDVHGRIVHEQVVAPEMQAATQDLAALTAGTYTVVALDKAGKRVATARLVRQ